MVGLLIGLGNPGTPYDNTRHNIGFDVMDALAARLGIDFSKQDKFSCLLAQYKTKKSSFYLIKPTTFMNLSGQSAIKLMQFYKSDSIFVVHDDLDLPIGALRFKKGGSSGGHNGLKSIDSHCGNEYYRLRLGIGRSDKLSVVDYVLGKFEAQEMEIKKNMLMLASDALIEWMDKEDFVYIQNRYTHNPNLQKTKENREG